MLSILAIGAANDSRIAQARGTPNDCPIANAPWAANNSPITQAAGQIWGTSAAFVQAHEYGHAYFYNALGGSFHVPACGAHDFFSTHPPLECAWEEGFGDYFAVFLMGSATGGMEGIVENMHQFTWDGPDGSLIEGPVSAFLYDLTDTNSFGAESHDVVQYPGSYIAEVISSCSIQEGTSAWLRASGIDHLVYCFQRDLDGVTNYFTSRSTKPTAQNQTSGVSNPAEVKRLWRKNLYKETI